MPRSTATSSLLAWFLLAPVVSAQQRPLDLVPDDAAFGLVVRNLADVLDKGERFFEDNDVDPNKAPRPATLFKQLLPGLGISKGLDEKGSIALVLPNLKKLGIEKVDPNDASFLRVFSSLVLVIPFDDLDRMAGNFDLKEKDLASGKVCKARRPSGFFFGDFYVAAQGKHLLLGLAEKPLQLVADRRPLTKALSRAHAKVLQEADVAVHFGTEGWGPVYHSLLRDLRKVLQLEDSKTDNKVIEQFVEALGKASFVGGGLTLGKESRLDVVASFPKGQAAAEARKFVSTLRAGPGVSDLDGLPAVDPLVAYAAKGDGVRNVAMARALLRVLLGKWLGIEVDLGDENRKKFLEAFETMYRHLKGSRAVVYLTPRARQDKVGRVAAIVVLDVDDPDAHRKGWAKLVEVANAAAPKVTRQDRTTSPRFAFKAKAEAIGGAPVDWLTVEVPGLEREVRREYERLLGPDWNKVRMVIQGKRVVGLVGSDVETLGQTLTNLKERKKGLTEHAPVAAALRRLSSERKIELHFNLRDWLPLLRRGASGLDAPPPVKELTSVALTVEEDRIGLQVRSAAEEQAAVVRLLGLEGRPEATATLHIPPPEPPILSVGVSPDGKTVVSSAQDGVVRLWDATTGKKVAALGGHAAGFSPDGKSLVLVDRAGALTIWDLATRKGQAIRHRFAAGVSVVLSPDGKTLASVPPDSVVRLWTLDLAKKRIAPRGEVSGAYFAAFRPDGKVVASGRAGFIVLTDVATLDDKAVLRGHPAEVVGFGPDGKVLASSEGKTINLWDLASGRVMERLDAPAAVSCLEFSPDGKVLAWASDGKIQLWDAAASKVRHAPLVHPGVRALSFSRAGKLLASGGEDGAVRLWDPATGKGRFVLGPHPVTVLVGREGSVPRDRIVPTLVAFRPDGMRLAAASGSLLALWGPGGRFESRALLEEEVCSVAFSPDGSRLAAGLVEGTIALHDGETGRERAVLRGPPGWVMGLAFSPDGKVLATVSVSAKEGLSRVRLWDIASGKGQVSPRDVRGVSETVAFSPDGGTLAYDGGDGTVKLWDVAEGKERAALKGGAKVGCSLAFSSDGKVLACASLEDERRTGEKIARLVLWDVSAQKIIRSFTLAGVAGAPWVAFSPEGKTLAWGGTRGKAELRSVLTRKVLAALDLEGDDRHFLLRGGMFSPDGKTLAAASGTLKVWDVDSGKELFTADGVRTAVFSPNGKTLAISEQAGTVKLWNVRALRRPGR
jgi:WD40 repeat protein